MKNLFRKILNALFGRKKKLNKEGERSLTCDKGIGTAKPVDKSEREADSERCQKILNYWLDAELFDLPECPMNQKEGKVSKPADNFLKEWDVEAVTKYKSKKLKVTEDSRLHVMFQCHRASYISSSEEKHPNYRIPRTYLVGQALIPHWDEQNQGFVWSRSDDDQDLIVNLATIRTLYRRCRESIPDNMSLSEWVEARLESIDTMLYTRLPSEDSTNFIKTNDLKNQLAKINRELADEFWPNEQARSYMLHQCQPIESDYDDFDKPHQFESGKVTFRWRFCYYPDGSEDIQLGPFYARDLEHIISAVTRSGTNALSHPLKSYLLSRKQQIEIGKAINNGDFFWPLTCSIVFGRWPENSEHGLSLLQTCAVNVTQNVKENPIVSVNGPPGTGKTTLLKDIIANKIVARTKMLEEISTRENWLTESETVNIVLNHSIIVASSNNKAVENISKELPSLAKMSDEYSERLGHFKELASEGEWGLFCAVLGNYSNRSSFKPLLKKIRYHLIDIKDFFYLNDWFDLLDKKGRNRASEILYQFTEKWYKHQKIDLLIVDIKKTKAFHDYNNFFEPFITGLIKVRNSEQSIQEFSDGWNDLDEEQWNVALEAIDKFKRQWFGKKLYEEHLTRKLKNAKQAFNEIYDQIKTLSDGIDSAWKLDKQQHLIGPSSYEKLKDESELQAERRLQLSPPLGSNVLNQYRSNLFLEALRLNEAILENAASQFSRNNWEMLEQLIDGHLETNEVTPEHLLLWSILFLFFPVVSTSLSSVESQFKLMQKKDVFGLAMIDEAGQAVNYHVCGLLQRSQQAIFVGDPIQLEPVTQMFPSIDIEIAGEFIPVSNQDSEFAWGDDYLVSRSSAQSIADNACQYMSKIGERKVGIPLLVHRRCTEPMFSIVNRIAYSDRMVLASHPFDWKALQSGWIHVAEKRSDIKSEGYFNSTEAQAALKLLNFLVHEHPEMICGGVYIITPFSNMRRELRNQWYQAAKSPLNQDWMIKACRGGQSIKDIDRFAENNIGTVHTFQGKEASTVIVCTAASKVRNRQGGITWVNSKPNLLNVAVTRAKHHLFIIGNQKDWSMGTISAELQREMFIYRGLEHLMRQPALPFKEHSLSSGNYSKPKTNSKVKVGFDFG